jgi:hypothetical protein
LVIVDGDRPVLCYNDGIVDAPREVKERIAPGARKYAVPRCNYIHPLYGLGGETLTEDWAVDHPHHRGIYWAWPEVDWQGKRGDLHALQKVFNHPTGKTRVESGPGFVEIVGEHEWRWEDGTAIVREQAVIRAYRRTGIGRPIDLEFRFVALGADVQVARRGQSHYGGLNVRLGPSPDQEIVTFTDPEEAAVRRAWSHRSGTPRGGDAVTALTILQSARNPAYPGDWVQYPNLSWVQPTFPAAGTRHTISKDRPLELRYRLWIHEGKQGPEVLHALWSDYHAELPKIGGRALERTFQNGQVKVYAAP